MGTAAPRSGAEWGLPSSLDARPSSGRAGCEAAPAAPRAWVSMLAALLLAAALTGSALAANYTEYTEARIENSATKDRIMQNLYRLVLDPARVSDNGRFFGYMGANSTVTQFYSTMLLNEIAFRMRDPEPQVNITRAFAIVGLNASNLSCGNATAGDCNTLAGSQGNSRIQNETRRFYETNWGGRTFEIARNRTALWSLQMQWWVQQKIGLVKVLDNARDVVA